MSPLALSAGNNPRAAFLVRLSRRSYIVVSIGTIGRFALHDRIVFVRSADNKTWTKTRLYPVN